MTNMYSKKQSLNYLIERFSTKWSYLCLVLCKVLCYYKAYKKKNLRHFAIWQKVKTIAMCVSSHLSEVVCIWFAFALCTMLQNGFKKTHATYSHQFIKSTKSIIGLVNVNMWVLALFSQRKTGIESNICEQEVTIITVAFLYTFSYPFHQFNNSLRVVTVHLIVNNLSD